MPTFSVVIPTFNRPKMLVSAVQSVISQTFDDYEILVADDASMPPASEALDKLSCDNIRVLRSEVRQGPAHARNRAIAEARGRYISLLDDDDRYLSDFLLRTHETLSSSPEVGFSWSGVRFVEAFEPASSHKVVEKRFPAHYATPLAMYSDLLDIGTGFGLTFRSECLQLVGPFNEALECVEDADLFLRLLVAGVQPVAIDGVLVEIYLHSGPKQTGIQMAEKRIAENQWLIDRYRDFFNTYPALRSQLQEYMARLGQLLRQ